MPHNLETGSWTQGSRGQQAAARIGEPLFLEVSTLTYQNLLCCRVPINSILGSIIRTYKKVGFGSLRYKPLSPVNPKPLSPVNPKKLLLRRRPYRPPGPWLGAGAPKDAEEALIWYELRICICCIYYIILCCIMFYYIIL